MASTALFSLVLGIVPVPAALQLVVPDAPAAQAQTAGCLVETQRISVPGASRILGLDVGADGSVYGADWDRNEVRRFDKDGNQTLLLVPSDASPPLVELDDVGVATDGTIYVAGSRFIWSFDPSGNQLNVHDRATLGPTFPGRWKSIAVGVDGTVYAFSFNRIAYRFDSTLTSLGGTFNIGANTSIGSIAAGPGGDWWAISANAIFKFNAAGTQILNPPAFTSGPSRFTSADTDAAGNLYVWDEFSARVTKYDPAGNPLLFGVDFAGDLEMAVDPDGSVWLQDDTTMIKYTLAEATELGLTKTVSTATANGGDPVTYTLEVTNNGCDATAPFTITDVFPAGYTSSANTPAPGTTFDGTTWTIPSLAAGDTATLTINGLFSAGGTFSNTATLDPGTNTDSDTSNNTATAPDVVVTGPPPPPPPAAFECAAQIDFISGADTSPSFTSIEDVVLDSAGNYYVANGGVVQVFDSNGTEIDELTEPFQASALAFDSLGNLHVADRTERIFVYDTSRTLILTITAFPSGTFEPVGVAVDASGDVWVIDIGNLELTRFSSTGVLEYSEILIDPPDRPWGGIQLAHHDGRLYFAGRDGDDALAQVSITDLTPALVDVIPLDPVGAVNPYGIEIDASGGVWVTDETRGDLYAYDSAFNNLLAFGRQSGNGPTPQFSNPRGLAVNAAIDRLYVADNGNNGLYVFELSSGAEFALTKTVSATAAAIGETVRYTLEVTNSGCDATAPLTVTDVFPAGYTSSANIPEPGTTFDGTTWTIPTLDAGATATLIIDGSFSAAGTFSNTATLDPGTNGDTDPSDNTATAAAVDVLTPRVPFECAANTAFHVSSSQVNIVDVSTAPFTPSNVGGAGVTLGGIGYNTEDNLLYGVSNLRDLWVIEGDGTRTDTGINVGTKTPFAGGFDNAGNLHMLFDVDLLYTVDVSTGTVTGPITLSRTTFIDDWAVNPVDGLLYGYDESGNNLFQIDPTTGAVTTRAMTGPRPSGFTDGAFFTPTGDLIVVDGEGKVFRIDDAATGTDIVQFTTAGVGSGDWAGCTRALHVEKDVAPPTAAAGSAVTYTITIGHGASGPLTDDLTDTLPAGLTIDAVTVSGTSTFTDNTITGTNTLDITGLELPPAGTVTVTVDASVDSAAVSGVVTNQASFGTLLSDFPGDPGFIDPTPLDISVEADLSVSKDDDVDPVPAGSPVTYTVTVDNAGPSDATNVVVADTLPAGVTFVSTSGCAEDPNGVASCALGTIVDGGSASYDIIVAVDADTAAGTITNRAAVSSDATDTNSTNDVVTEDTEVTVEGDLSVAFAANPDPALAGTDLTITATVTNNGPSDVPDFTITAPVPPNATFNRAASDATCSESGGTVTCNGAATAAGDSIDVDIVFTVDPLAADGSRVNTTVTASTTATDPDTSDDSVAVSVTVGSPDTDGDGVPDSIEVLQGTDPASAASFLDGDGDGVPDYVEDVVDGTDSTDNTDYVDGDGDGVPDYVEINADSTDPADATSYADGDGDLVPDFVEDVLDGTDSADATDYADGDGDLVPDFVEDVLDGTDSADGTDYADGDGDEVPDFVESNLDSTDPADAGAFRDGDGDGVPDYVENLIESTDPAIVTDFLDTDGDEVPDYVERNATPPTDETAPALFPDGDGDGVPTYVEAIEGTSDADPSDYKDGDGDGVPDYVERQDTTDPADPTSFIDGDGDEVADYVETNLDSTDETDEFDFLDSDGDGVPDRVELREGTIATDASSFADNDSDEVPDYVEVHGFEISGALTSAPSDPNDAQNYTDKDGDFVPDHVEVRVENTDPCDITDFVDTAPDNGTPDYLERTPDDDGDGVPNGVELGASPPTAIDDANSYPDADGDLVPDFVEQNDLPPTDETDPTDYADADGDEVPDYVEDREGTDPNDPTSFADADGDGVPDYVETIQESTDENDVGDFADADGDEVPDYIERRDNTAPGDPTAFTDSDGDGVPDYVEDRELSDSADKADYADADGDLVPDYVERREGTDPANTSDHLDSDGDGVPDYVETFIESTDPNDIASFLDTDAGGVPDYVETFVDLTDPTDPSDELDSDGDGVPDYVEGLDMTDPTDPTDYKDSDGDGVPDFVEEKVDGTDPADKTDYADADGDLVPDFVEDVLDGTDSADSSDFIDTDGDGVPDFVEDVLDGTDSADSTDYADGDGDEVPDYVEEKVDGTDPASATDYLDSDGDLVPDYVETVEVSDPADKADYADGDGDLVPDYIERRDSTDPTVLLDYIDSDGDGVPDYVEIVIELTDPGDVASFLDTDGGGVPDFIEIVIDLTDPTDPADDKDTDGDGVPDYVEAIDMTDPVDPTDYKDSDGDLVPDFVESTVDGTDPTDPASVKDTDGDEVPDYVEGQEGTDASSPADFLDTDGDGVPDYVETVLESTDPADGASFLDTDGGGVPDYVERQTGADPNDPSDDTDSDGDGVPDGIETMQGTDPTDDSSFLDGDGDGAPDFVESTVDGTDPADPTDFLDTDGDGVADTEEKRLGSDPNDNEDFTDDNGDGIPDPVVGRDLDGDGLTDDAEYGDGDRGVPADTDGDGTPDFLDTDDDGDGKPTADEDINADGDGDGVPDPLDPDQAVDLQIDITTSDTQVEPGNTVTVDVTVTNSGPDDATDVQVTLSVPPGTDFVPPAGAAQSASVQSAATSTSCALVSGSVVCPVGDIANGASAAVAIDYLIGSGAPAELSFTATASTGDVEITAEDNTVVLAVRVQQPPAPAPTPPIAFTGSESRRTVYAGLVLIVLGLLLSVGGGRRRTRRLASSGEGELVAETA